MPYREEIFHPGLPDALTTRGHLTTDGDGALIRVQSWPVKERTRIGQRFIRIEDADGAENLLPIPDHLAPFIDVMRALTSGEAGALVMRYRPQLTARPEGWEVTLAKQGALGLRILGCGTLIHALEVDETGGARRVLHFGPLE